VKLDEKHEKKLIELGRSVIDQEKAKILIPPLENAAGFWFGSGNMIEDGEGRIYLCGRYRNSGDSRTGVAAGARGAELAIFRSGDQAESFEKILSFSKKDLSYPGREVLSIERMWLHQVEGGIELYVSSEKKGLSYPLEIASYQKKGTGVWTIDIIRAPSVEQLDPSSIEPLIEGRDPRFYHFKDPMAYANENGDTVMIFSTHPFSWASSNSGMAVRRRGEDGFGEPDCTFFPRGFTWDVAISRICGLIKVPKIGSFSRLAQVYLFFYDGGESMRNYEEHVQAVKRPRGYSCEEIGGLAYTTEEEFPRIHRLSVNLPMFVSPYGTGCSRYMTALQTERGIYGIWEQSQPDLSQPLVMNFIRSEDVEALL